MFWADFRVRQVEGTHSIYRADPFTSQRQNYFFLVLALAVVLGAAAFAAGFAAALAAGFFAAGAAFLVAGLDLGAVAFAITFLAIEGGSKTTSNVLFKR